MITVITTRDGRRAPVVASAVALACLILVTACGGSDDKDPARTPLSPPPVGPLPTVSAAAARSLPLAAFAYSADDLQALSKAEGLLTQKCMRRLGFTTWQPPTPTRPNLSWTTGLKIGIVDAELAARWGYHSPQSANANTRDPNAPSRPDQQAELAALTGDGQGTAGNDGKQIPPGGCTGEAERAVRDGAPKFDRELFGHLSDQAGQATEGDQRIVDAVAAWSACMKRSGQQYRAPWEAAEQTWAATPTATEIALATTDVACKTETKLPGIWFGVLSGYQQQLIDRNKAGLDAAKAGLDAEIRKANSILSSGG